MAEGFHINDRELTRLRIRFQWFLRENGGRGAKRKFSDARSTSETKEKAAAPTSTALIDQLATAILQEELANAGAATEVEGTRAQAECEESMVEDPQTEQALEPIELLRRQQRQQQLQIESDEKWRTRKRRRRTRGWAGLPADAPGEPPRFPSETTLDESKAYLGLDNRLYKEMRDQFQSICEEQGVVKKTIAGPEKWGQLLQRLVRENAHLADVFRQEPGSLEQTDATWRPKNYKALSLDVICQDVTKRMRTLVSRMGIPEAKNVLGLNPEQTRLVRSAFLAILKADHFTSKFEAGDEHWNELKHRWVRESEYLSSLVGHGADETDPQHAQKLKAVEVLARDVMKRLQAEKTQNDPSRRKQVHQGPGPGPATPSTASNVSGTQARQRASRTATNTNMLSRTHANAIQAISANSDLQIDPSLLLAASDAAILPPHAPPGEIAQAVHQQHHPDVPLVHGSLEESIRPPYPLSAHVSPPAPSSTTPLPIYFRLNSHSTTPFPQKTVWLSVLQEGTLAEVRSLAMREHPGTVVVKLAGVMVHRSEGSEREVMVAIDDDEELAAFLGHVAGGKATFVVLLNVSENGDRGYA